MSQDFHTANFKYITINEDGLRTILHCISRHDITYDFRITEELYNDTKINEIFKHYPKFDIELYTVSFSYNLYLNSVNFKNHIINYENIDVNSISYYILRYLRKHGILKNKI